MNIIVVGGVVAVKADLVSTIILNPSTLSSATVSIAEDERLYHLVNYSNCAIVLCVCFNKIFIMHMYIARVYNSHC